MAVRVHEMHAEQLMHLGCPTLYARTSPIMSPASSLDQAIAQVNDLIAELEAGQSPDAPAQPASKPQKPIAEVRSSDKPAAASKAKKLAKPGTSQQNTNAAQPGVTELFSKAQLKVAKVTSVEEIDSAKLYKCTVDVGDGVTKHVMAGLKQHIPQADLLHSMVIVITNLKPAKLAGNLSEVMILAAQGPQPDDPQGELVKSLQPPEGAQAGDMVFLEGSQPSESYPKQLKSDIWKKIVAEFKVMQGVACCANQKLCTQHGIITLPHVIPDGAGIH